MRFLLRLGLAKGCVLCDMNLVVCFYTLAADSGIPGECSERNGCEQITYYVDKLRVFSSCNLEIVVI